MATCFVSDYNNFYHSILILLDQSASTLIVYVHRTWYHACTIVHGTMWHILVHTSYSEKMKGSFKMKMHSHRNQVTTAAKRVKTPN